MLYPREWNNINNFKTFNRNSLNSTDVQAGIRAFMEIEKIFHLNFSGDKKVRLIVPRWHKFSYLGQDYAWKMCPGSNYEDKLYTIWIRDDSKIIFRHIECFCPKYPIINFWDKCPYIEEMKHFRKNEDTFLYYFVLLHEFGKYVKNEEGAFATSIFFEEKPASQTEITSEWELREQSENTMRKNSRKFIQEALEYETSGNI